MLFYRRAHEMMAVDFTEQPVAIAPSSLRVHFAGTFLRDMAGDQDYDITPDGRLLLLRPLAGGRVSIQAAINWIAEVRARLNRAR